MANLSQFVDKFRAVMSGRQETAPFAELRAFHPFRSSIREHPQAKSSPTLFGFHLRHLRTVF